MQGILNWKYYLEKAMTFIIDKNQNMFVLLTGDQHLRRALLDQMAAKWSPVSNGSQPVLLEDQQSGYSDQGLPLTLTLNHWYYKASCF